MFRPAIGIAGEIVPEARLFPIAKSTVVQDGVAVVISAGKVVKAGVTATALLGISAENHTANGSQLDLRPRDKILVYCSKEQIYEVSAPTITATSGSKTTIGDTAMDASGTDDVFIGGIVKAITGTNKDSSKEITDSTKQLFTVESFDAAVVAGDKFMIFPPIGFKSCQLSANADGLDFGDETASFPLVVVGRDIERGKVFVKVCNHTFD